jgi:ribosomal protein S1
VRIPVSIAVVAALISSTFSPALAQSPAAKGEAKASVAKNVSGTVKSSSAEALVVAGRDKGKDAEWTFALEPATNIRKGSKSITGGDIKPGDSVQVRYTEQAGKAVAQSVTVKAAKKDAKETKR